MRSLCSRWLFHLKLLVKRLLTSVFVLVNGIVFNRSKGLITECLISCIKHADELKEVKSFQRNNRFQEPYNVKYFKGTKCLKYSKSRGVFTTQASIYDGVFL